MLVPGCAGRAATTSASGSSVARRAASRSSPRVSSSAHWASSRKSASGRSSASSTISHHSACTTASPRDPGLLGSAALLQGQHPQPGRAVGRHVAGRPAEQHPRSGERHAGLDVVGGRVEDAQSCLLGAGARQSHEARLADPGLAFDEHGAALPGGRRADDLVKDGQLGLSLDQHVHTSSVLPRIPGGNRDDPGTGGGTGLVPVAVPAASTTRLAASTERTQMIARLAEHSHLPADLDPEYIARHRAWDRRQPGFCGGYHLLEPDTGHALSLTMWQDEDALAAVERAQAASQDLPTAASAPDLAERPPRPGRRRLRPAHDQGGHHVIRLTAPSHAAHRARLAGPVGATALARPADLRSEALPSLSGTTDEKGTCSSTASTPTPG